MNILRFLERLNPVHRERENDAIAKKLYREIQTLPDNGVVPAFIDRELAKSVPCSEQELRALVDVLARLPLRQRQVMELSLRDFTTPQIAEQLGITTRVACHELALAMGTLRREGHGP